MSDTIDPTDAERAAMDAIISGLSAYPPGEYTALRAHVAAEVAKATAERDELLEEIYNHTVNLRTYPDGPCMDREYRDRIKAILAARAQRKDTP